VDPDEPDLTRFAPSHPAARLVLAATVTAVWLMALGGLALFTANPVTLNRRQIELADAVITGRVLNKGHRDVAVERVWKGGDLPEGLRVENLDEAPVEVGHVYVIPLTRNRERYAVAATRRTPAPEGSRLVYPATPTALEQLRDILADDAP
jgi:hypothetical protein